MQTAIDVEDAEKANFPWPDPALYIDPALCRRLVDEAPEGKTILAWSGPAIFRISAQPFGMENAMMNMLAAPELVHYVDDRIMDFYLKALKIFLDATKGKLHAILIGDDLGSQFDLMISPEMVKEFVIPGAKKLIDLAHSYGVKVIYHSCGSIIRAIPMLIEAGVDVIHPIQALAKGMQPENLKEKFGGTVSFCGGVDTQELLPNGTPEQVMEEGEVPADAIPDRPYYFAQPRGNSVRCAPGQYQGYVYRGAEGLLNQTGGRHEKDQIEKEGLCERRSLDNLAS